MIDLKNIKKVLTSQDLENLGIGRVIYNVGDRGGNVGFTGSDVAKVFEISKYDLPKNFGCGCNYLGGGLRGSIFASDFSDRITGKKAKILKELALACIRVYEYIENGEGLNNEEYPDGDTNWEAKGTKASRKSRIISAY